MEAENFSKRPDHHVLRLAQSGTILGFLTRTSPLAWGVSGICTAEIEMCHKDTWSASLVILFGASLAKNSLTLICMLHEVSQPVV